MGILISSEDASHWLRSRSKAIYGKSGSQDIGEN